jgi:hypothetical protein
MALALGPMGRETLVIGNRSVPVSEIANMLSVLSGAAATPSQPQAAVDGGEEWAEDEMPAAADVEARMRADMVADLLHQEAVAMLASPLWPGSWDVDEELDETYYEAVYE